MRKRIVSLNRIHGQPKSDRIWLELEQIATVEVTSEDPGFPIEAVFSPHEGSGWRASEKGEQQIRIIFDQPLSVHRIQLGFLEREFERTQEFIIRWSAAAGGPTNEIMRQQWNFSPAGSTSEVEDYDVSLDGVSVSVLELVIKPDLTRKENTGDSGILARCISRAGTGVEKTQVIAPRRKCSRTIGRQ